ncbi:MAG: SAM-dependent methyltransferase [Clostridiales bacterium]|nr:SAM-dependent methyltransferase [Clostridiales bacterium]
MSKMSYRLQVVASLVTGRVVCDVGCDHGKLAYHLLSRKIVDKVIVSDISAPSLDKAKDLLSNSGFDYEAICCDGLKGYEGKSIDQCIIAGMGGDEIIKILSTSPIKVPSMVISPQHNIIAVKRFLLENKYNIDYDIIIKDKGKFYNIIRANLLDHRQELSDEQLIIGKANALDERSAVDEFVTTEIAKLENILNTHNVRNEEMDKYYRLLLEYKKRN